MTRIFLIRHAEPLALWGGEDPDPGLSEAGRAQAAEAAAALAATGLALAIVSSPMRRCRETAAAFERLSGGDAAIEPRISEVATPPQISDRRAWLAQNFALAPGLPPRLWQTLARDLQDWRAQALAAVRGVNQDTAMFTHFIAINAIVSALQGADATIVCRPDYASITELALDAGVFRVAALGKTMQAGAVG